MKQQPILVFGAALKQDGTPQRVLMARIEAAVHYGNLTLHPLYIVTGGNPKQGITEAEVMKQLLLKHGVSEKQIICEDQAQNTIQSVLICSVLLQKLGFSKKQTTIFIVSNAYHLPRCWWLMFLSGWHTCCIAALGKASRNFYKCWVWRLREIPAVIWDSFRILL